MLAIEVFLLSCPIRVVFAVTDGSFMSDPVQLTITVQPDNDNAPQLVLMPRVVVSKVLRSTCVQRYVQ